LRRHAETFSTAGSYHPLLGSAPILTRCKQFSALDRTTGDTMQNRVADIASFLDGVGLKHLRNTNQFWAYLDSRYARNQVGDLERAYLKLERGDEAAFYQEIFQSLKVSIDFASLRHDLYRSYLEWFVSSITQTPEVVVDAGCGNGLLTCFYAQHFPKARVIGFDISAAGIECAKELAGQLGVKNIEFVVSDASDLTLPIEKGSVNLITTVASLGPPPGAPVTESSAYDLISKKPRLNQILQIGNLAPYLEPENGQLISFDKVSTLAQQATWANIIQSCGLGIDLSSSAWLSYQNIESDTIALPALVAGPHVKPSSNHELLAFFATRNIDLSQWTLDFGQEGLAELVFTFVNPKTYIRGARANYTDGSGIYWYELWQAGPFNIIFEHTDQGFRTLRVASSTQKAELLRSVDDWIEQTSSYATVTELQSPEVRFDGNEK